MTVRLSHPLPCPLSVSGKGIDLIVSFGSSLVALNSLLKYVPALSRKFGYFFIIIAYTIIETFIKKSQRSVIPQLLCRSLMDSSQNRHINFMKVMHLSYISSHGNVSLPICFRIKSPLYSFLNVVIVTFKRDQNMNEYFLTSVGKFVS